MILISPDVIPGRMALLITILLVLVNLFGSVIRIQPPHTAEPSALDIWFIACIIFVCGALFSYAALLFILHSLRSRKKISTTSNSPKKNQTKQSKSKNETSNWDRNCLISFPLTFVLFILFVYLPIVVFKHQPM